MRVQETTTLIPFEPLLFQRAIELHQSGELAHAERLYKEVLKSYPGHINTIFLLGTLNLQQEHFDAATILLLQVIAQKPKHFAAHNNIGTAFREQGKFEEAVEKYKHAIELKPDYEEAYYNLGTTFQVIGKLEEAADSFRKAMALNPESALVHYSLGNVFKEQRNLCQAILCLSQAIKLNPAYAMAHNNLGSLLQETGQLDEAVESYNRAIELKPDYAMAYNNLGSILQKMQQLDEAIENYDHAIELNPENAMAYNNLGSALQELGQLDEAIESYDHAIELKPDYAMAYNNLGSALQELGKLTEAVESYDRAIRLLPDEATAHKNRSTALLLMEEFKEGWTEYEWRLSTKDHSLRNFRQPKWDGKRLCNRQILVHSEQGFGDTIQFVRYLPMVRSMGGRVIFECRQELYRLLKDCEGIDNIIERTYHSDIAVPFDVQVPLMSLPGIFNTTTKTIPTGMPYITPDSKLAEDWHRRLGNDRNFKIGIVWSGNPEFRNQSRSCSLADFSPLANIPGITFYSLQKGKASKETFRPPEGMDITNLENELHDFADTAAIIANLDLIISTDTAVVHLAGAIGKRVWVLLHYIPDWRWLLRRSNSAWYPGMRLFRQIQLHDWASVFDQVKDALRQEEI
ncbi:MAG: tetratricopeptide repeat protein [Planctomycetes bacterium]|nr:tetratricopeptide repeat protein [Planctomycetota bacterium]